MTEGAPWKHILRFTLPIFLGALLQQLYNTADSIIVGRFSGEDALSAVGTTGSFVFLFMALAIGFSSGNGVVVAQHYGAKNEKEVRDNASTGLLFLLTLGLVMMALGLVIARPAFKSFVAVPPEILDQAVLYFRLYALGLVFQFGYNSVSSILRAVGDSASTLYLLLLSSVLNVGLDILFVAGFHWGVAGAAIATDISQFVAFAAAAYYMKKKYPMFRFSRSDYKWRKGCVVRTVKIGLPISLQMVVISMGLTFIQRAANGFGQTMTAAYSVGQRIEMFINQPAIAMQTTLATYTGQNLGAGKHDRLRKGLWQGVLMSLLFTLVFTVILLLFNQQIVEAFALSPEAAGYGVRYLRAVALCNILLSLYVPLFGFYQGLDHSAVPMIVAMCVLSLRVIVVYLLKDTAFMGCSILWWNGLAGFSMGLLVCWGYYFSGKWKRGRFFSSEAQPS